MGQDRCPDCGAHVANGQDGCQAVFDELAVRAYGDLTFAAMHPLAFDAYCMQHRAKYCRSAKSYAAHLTRLCCGIEHEGNPLVYAAIQRWLNGLVDIKKPELLSHLGTLTVMDAAAAGDANEYKRRVREWAQSVWDAYSSQHELARGWIRAALGVKQKR